MVIGLKCMKLRNRIVDLYDKRLQHMISQTSNFFFKFWIKTNKIINFRK